MENNLVTQANALIEASYSMTINEQRLLLACISQIDSRQAIEEGKEFVLTVQQAQDLFFQDSDRMAAFQMLQRSAEHLFRREVRITLDENRELLTHFVQAVTFDKVKKEIRVLFAEKIKPYLTQLENNFTKYRLANIVHLKSAYAVRFYQLLCEWQGQGRDMEILSFEKINEMLGSPYTEFGKFRKYVLDIAVEQINIYTDFVVHYAQQKTGRKVSHIQLRWEIKDKPENIEHRKIQNKQQKALRLKKELEQAEQELIADAVQAFESLANGTQFIDADGVEWIKKDNLPCTVKDNRYGSVSVFARQWFINQKIKIVG
ncbi:MAG: replication initiation protein [Selenomonadaceae bacterium]|nr:replication initiation protein [Selenomonadaceae bacterium]